MSLLSHWKNVAWRRCAGSADSARANSRHMRSRTARLRDRLRAAPPLLACAGFALLLSGATPAPKKVKRPPPAWIAAKTMCIFPLADDGLPRTGGQLAEAMLGGWKGVFTLRDPDRAVYMQGGRYPAIDSLNVDLSGAVAKTRHNAAKIPDPVQTSQRLAVAHFNMVAEPLVNQHGRINVRVVGRDVRFDLQHDKAGKPILMMCDARDGMLQIDTTKPDLQKIALAMAREMAGAHAIGVRSLSLDLKSLGPRSLNASLHLSTLVGFVPAGLRFTARVDIDDQMNARISHLTCDGDEVLGPLIVGLIRPSLDRYEGKTRPLLSFPSDNVKLKDVRITAGEHIELMARFGR